MVHFLTSETLSSVLLMFFFFGVLFCCEMPCSFSGCCFLVWIIQTTNSLTDLIILQHRLDLDSCFDTFCFVKRFDLLPKTYLKESVLWSRTKKFLCWKVFIFVIAVFRLVLNHPNEKQLWEMFHFSTSESSFSVLLMFFCFWILVLLWNNLSPSVVCFLVLNHPNDKHPTEWIILQQREDSILCLNTFRVCETFWFVAEDLFEKKAFWTKERSFCVEKWSVGFWAVFCLVSNHPNDKQLCEMFHFSISES